MRTSRTHSPLPVVVAILAALAAVVATAAPARADRTFGEGPTSEVLQAARDHKDDCSTVANRLTTDQLVALVLAPTFPETGAPSTSSPAPMTMSRYDNQDSLHSFGNPDTYRAAFWHPGIGPWQWDDASLRGFTSFDRIDTRVIAEYTTAYIASRWCNDARFATVWGPWNGCRNGNCKAIYDELLDDGQLTGLAREAAVGVLGGMEAHTCTNGSADTFRCWFIDPDRAQGYDGFARPGFGPAPITAPFLAYRSGDTAHRHWLRDDTGFGIDIRASLLLGLNSRSGSLDWQRGSQLCDVTRGVGLCDPIPPAGFDLVTESVGGTYTPVAGDFDGNGRGDIFWYAPGPDADSIWSGTAGRGFRSASTSVRGDYEPLAGDFDGDGRSDVLWYGRGGAPDSIWYGRADGGFDFGNLRVSGTYDPVVGDFDGDLGDDLIWYAPGPAGDSSWYSQGGRGFRVVDVDVSGVYEPVAGDLDDDGRDDVLWYAPGPASDALWSARGSGFRSQRLHLEGDFVPLVADFDGARGDDVFFYRAGPNYDAVWWQVG